MQISRIIVFTPNVDRLAGFYTSAFDLAVIDGGNSNWTELEAGGCTIAFHRIDEHSTTRDG